MKKEDLALELLRLYLDHPHEGLDIRRFVDLYFEVLHHLEERERPPHHRPHHPPPP